MTESTLLEWRGYRYFPYEKAFAKLEVERLFNTTPVEVEAGLAIDAEYSDPDSIDRLTYIGKAHNPSGNVVIPKQTRLEASAHVNGRNTQSTRYSAHGLHEYKGKFNPQVVRAIGNMLELGDSANVLDPFCGSGTTVLEGAHLSWNVLGLDINPLAVQIANAKVRAIQLGPDLVKMAEDLETALALVMGVSEAEHLPDSELDGIMGEGWQAEVPSADYLIEWFPTPVLAQAVGILRAIRGEIEQPADRLVFEVILSDLLREASLQEPADLRIRRRKNPKPNYPLVKDFIEESFSRSACIQRAREQLGSIQGRQEAFQQDVTSWAGDGPRGWEGKLFDAVITSPPYATALPYIDTQRLSLVLLGHIEAGEIREVERSLIGARDVTVRQRRQLEERIEKAKAELPTMSIDLCRELLDAARRPGNGFRRRNKPALIYRYFEEMSLFFKKIKKVLKPKAKVALVVGTNKTTLGGLEFVIDTPGHLAAIAEYTGFNIAARVSMDTYARYDLHQNNSIDSEALILLEMS